MAPTVIRDGTGKEVKLRPVHANSGIRAAYRRKLLALVDEMADSYLHWLRATYRANPPEMTMDALPAKELERQLRKLAKRWERNFDDTAEALAEYFAGATRRQTDRALRSILKKGGWSVQMKKMTPTMRDVMSATVAENVSLIKSIPRQYHSQVAGIVMRSVTEGRNLSYLTRELQKRRGVTKRRAQFIALDQNNKATAAFRRARETDLGLNVGIWIHSGGGKEPRPTHVRQSGKRFSIRDGWPDPALKGKRIWPGTEPGCRCTWRAVVKGFS